MTIQILGSKLSGAPTLRGFVPYYQWSASPTTVIRTPAAGFLESLGFWFKANATGWSVMLGVYAVANGEPQALLARTAAIPYTATGVAAGVNLEAQLEWVNVSAAPGSVQKSGSDPARLYLANNTPIMLAWYVVGYNANNTMSFGSNDTASNKIWYQAANGTGMLTNPFAHTATPTLYYPGAYATFNVPSVPSVGLTSPADGASIAAANPVFSGTFATTDPADTFSAYQVEVWLNAGTAPLRDSGVLTTNATQQSAKTWQYTYDGPELLGGTTYKWRARVQALAGGWTDYTAFRTFSKPVAIGIDLATSAVPVSGSKIDRPDLMTWAARWYHNGNQAMDRVQIQIRNPDGSVVVTSNAITKAVATPVPDSPPGKLFTVSQAEALAGGLNTATLLPGRTYHAYLRGRAATSQVYSDYAGPLIFRTNALAGAPELVTPVDESSFSTRPELVVRGYDPDVEDVPGADTIWQFEVVRVSTGASVVTNAGAYVPGATPALSEARLQLTSTQVPAVGAYRWRARSVEADAGPAGTSEWTAWWDFTFSEGPTAAITSPVQDEQIPTSAVRIAWSNSEAQKFYQVQVFEQGSNARRYVTTVIASEDRYHDIPLGALPPNIPYYARVTVFNPASIQGTSADVRFTVVPGAIVALNNATVVVLQLPGDVELTTPELAWARSGHPEARFRSYLVRRYITALGRASAVLVAEIRNIAQISLRDYHAPPGVGLTYLVSQRGATDAGDVTESIAVTLTTRVDLLTPMIVGLTSPHENRFPVRWQQNGPPSEQIKTRRSVVQTWGADGKPTIFKAPGGQKLRSVKFTVRNDAYGSADAKKDRITETIESGSLVSYRNGRDRLFMDISDNGIAPGDAVGTWDVTLSLEETAFREVLG